MKFQINHDIHCHTQQSYCSSDPEMTPQKILDFAVENEYDTVCLTDHFWDAAVPEPNKFYTGQDYDHVSVSLPLPEAEGVRFLFGCETEYPNYGRVAINSELYDKFSFIIVPPNHFHFRDIIRPMDCDTEEKVSEHLISRLEELTTFDLPWRKVGIAHLNCHHLMNEGDFVAVLSMIDEERLKSVFHFFAEHGTGIELNASCFPNGWLDRKEEHLRLYKIARDAGCKFYCGSDAHHPNALPNVKARLGKVAELLELTTEDRYLIP